MIKFKAYCGKITRVEIAKETAKQVVFANGRREYRHSKWVSYHDTFEDAKNYMLDACQRKIDSLEHNLRKRLRERDEIKAMEPPTE